MRAYEGQSFRPCEVGHTLLVPSGEHCYCGKRGRVDPYCGGTVLADEAGEALSCSSRCWNGRIAG